MKRLLNALCEYHAAWVADDQSRMTYWAIIVQEALGLNPAKPADWPLCQ